jgi:hypothetical protein
MEFKEFKVLLQEHVKNIFKDQDYLFVTSVDKDQLWEIYLNSFPPGTNEIYRERREHDCSCCRHFIKSFGNVVVIKNNQLVSIWDFETNDSTFQSVITSLSKLVKSFPIQDVFITKESKFGTDFNFEKKENQDVTKWHHFFIDLPKKFVCNSIKSEESIMGEFRDIRNVFKRSLDEISKDSIESILDLISQNSLYKGEEWQNVLQKFLNIHIEYRKLNDTEKEIFCWAKSREVGPVVGKIRNHSIGVLLTDITNGVELDEAVRRYEKITAPTNYKRPKAIFTKKMIEDAEKTIVELGLENSLQRRYAVIDDIRINNILYANKDVVRQQKSGVFEELKKESKSNAKKFDRVEEIPIEKFITDILPRTTNLELFLENKHESNLVSLIAPEDLNSKNMFKWNNNFSWAYNGNITDSMKERVKAAGGKVDGILRFSIQWNEEGDNQNDFDAHCVEPNKNHIWFYNKGQKHLSTGVLDVDIIRPDSRVAVENITWTDKRLMQNGIYSFYVNVYNYRFGRSGFRAEIEYEGQIYSYNYNKDVQMNENILVAKIKFDKEKGIEFIESLDSTTSNKTVWNLQTNQFQPVSFCMFSPNHWDEDGVGHRHYFFMLKNCRNSTSPNGFFNEFLREDLMIHKRVFEALGSKMKVEDSNNQLSGIGFSATKRNDVIVKVEGHISRMLKLIF